MQQNQYKNSQEESSAIYVTDRQGKDVLDYSHLIFAVVLAVLGVPYSDDDVSGAEVEIWVICDVVHAHILLHTDNLDESDK